MLKRFKHSLSRSVHIGVKWAIIWRHEGNISKDYSALTPLYKCHFLKEESKAKSTESEEI